MSLATKSIENEEGKDESEASGFLGLGLITVLAFFVLDGLGRKTHLFGKVRELVLGSSISDWAMGLAGVVLLLLLLWAFGLLLPRDLCYGRRDRLRNLLRTDLARDGALNCRVEEMLRSMRLQGLEEDNLRQFVCKYSGPNWEGFYESLFGYAGQADGSRTLGRLLNRPKYVVENQS